MAWAEDWDVVGTGDRIMGIGLRVPVGESIFEKQR